MLAIFGFRKNRNHSASNQGPEAEAEVYGDAGHVVATPPTGFVFAGSKAKNLGSTGKMYRKENVSVPLPGFIPALETVNRGRWVHSELREDGDKYRSESTLLICWYKQWPIAVSVRRLCVCRHRCRRQPVAPVRSQAIRSEHTACQTQLRRMCVCVCALGGVCSR